MTYRFASTWALRAIQLALLVEAVVRGMSYLATPPNSSILLSAIEGSAPLWLWGWLFITFGVLGLAGEWWMDGGSFEHRYWPSFVAHAGLWVTFLAFTVSAGVGVFTRQPLYGYNGVYDLALLALGHFIFARRRKHEHG